MQDIFNDKMSTMKNRAINQQAEAIQRQMMSKGPMSAAALQAIDQLAQGNTLEQTLDGIADILNQSIEKTYNTSSYDQIIAQAGNFNSILEEGKASARQLNEFFNLITQAIAQINNGAVPRDLLTGLAKIGKDLGPASFRLAGNSTRVINKAQLDEVDKILTYLSNAGEKLKKEGFVSADSFTSTIRNIFSTVIGEKLSMVLLGNALVNMDSAIMQAFKEIGITVNGASPYSPGGGSSNKVDIFNSDAFNLSVNMPDNSTMNIEIGSNTSVKWYQDIAKGKSADIHLVSKTTFGQLIREFDNDIARVMRNIVAHSKDNEPIYWGLRSVLSASFVNQWLAGKGNISQQNKIDTAQFIMINGKLYSVLSLVSKIVDETLQYATIGSTPRTDINGISSLENKWLNLESGEKGMWAAAYRRSNPLKEAIDRLTISCTFNSNFLP